MSDIEQDQQTSVPAGTVKPSGGWKYLLATAGIFFAAGVLIGILL